ncbi:sulfatase-like hydrolase/transferase [Candidatus Fermentibacteria bacterium]|nr:sulfatase-like hydrolase/transferase [Candidatus Fermentibacteria bacterium]
MIPIGLGSGRHYIEGFFAPGDTGRAMKGGMAALRIDAVSGGPRSLVFELTAPPAGGELRVTGPRGHVVVSSSVDSGRRLVSGVVPAGALADGENRFIVMWRSAAQGPAGGMAIREAWVNPVGEGKLSYVDYDSLRDDLHIGAGASVEVFLVPDRKASLGFRTRGDGVAAIEVAHDGHEPEMVLVKDAASRPLKCSVPVPTRKNSNLMGVRLMTTERSLTSWSNVVFSGLASPEWMVIPSASPGRSRADPLRSSNILVYVVDTVRRDHLQIYGYDRPTTPYLADHVNEWSIWDNCQSLSSWTRPSTATILTGLDPIAHGAITEASSLAPGVPSIWDPYRLKGWEVAYLTTNDHVDTRWGFARNVDFYRHFETSPIRRTIHLAADSLHLAFLAWLDHRESPERPFFAYLHATDPHGPYTPPKDLIPLFYPEGCPSIESISSERLKLMVCPGNVEPWERDAAEALYDAEIAAWDGEFARLLRELDGRGILEKTVILLTSDHGEEFGEHGSFSHGLTLYREQLEVPFLARIPGVGGTRRHEPVDHRDVPGLLGWIMEDHDQLWTPPMRPNRPSHLSLRGFEKARLQTDEFALIWHTCPIGSCGIPVPEFELFLKDSAETADVADHHAVLCRAGRAMLDGWIRSAAYSEPRSLDERTMDHLRLLGYITDE